ncbi:MAG: hypothetical protein ACOC0Z_03280 [Halohasta sp.]
MDFRNPAVRWAIGLQDAIVVAAVAYFFLDGTTQVAAYVVAVFDLVATPLILKRAAEQG